MPSSRKSVEAKQSQQISLTKQRLNPLSVFKTQNALMSKNRKFVWSEVMQSAEKLILTNSGSQQTFINLRKRLDSKIKELNELKAKHIEIRRNFQNLHQITIAKHKQYIKIESTFQTQRKALLAKLRSAYNKLVSAKKIIKEANDKEEKYAAYLKDMLAKLKNTTLNKTLLEKQVSKMETENSELKNLVEVTKKDAEVQNQETIDQCEMRCAKLRKKLIKKTKRLSTVKQQYNDLEIKNKDLKKALEIEGHKIRELQCVLNRPINRSSPVREKKNASNLPTEVVEPAVSVNDTTSGSSCESSAQIKAADDLQASCVQAVTPMQRQLVHRTPTDQVQQNTESNVDQLNVSYQNQSSNWPSVQCRQLCAVIDDFRQNQPQEEIVDLSYSGDQLQQNTERNVDQLNVSNQNQLSNRSASRHTIHHTEDETSDNISFPAYNPK